MQKKNKTDHKPTNIFMYLQLSKLAFSKSIKSLEQKSKIVVPELGGFGLVGFFIKKLKKNAQRWIRNFS